MADSDALRARRARAHRQGNHELCDRDRCDVLRPREPVTHGCRIAVEKWAEAFDVEDGDPRQVLIQGCLKLADDLDRERGAPQAMKQLVETMSEMKRQTERIEAEKNPSPIDVLLARRARRLGLDEVG
jgi:hypothetical protein